MSATQAEFSKLLQAGETLRAIATKLGLSLTTAWRRAKSINCARRQHLTDEQRSQLRRLIRNTRKTNVQIAEEVGVHFATVSKYRHEVIETRETLAEAVRCSSCGHKINVAPCLRCVRDEL
jgi:DNA-binding Lrp family transcriptional regulator